MTIRQIKLRICQHNTVTFSYCLYNSFGIHQPYSTEQTEKFPNKYVLK